MSSLPSNQGIKIDPRITEVLVSAINGADISVSYPLLP